MFNKTKMTYLEFALEVAKKFQFESVERLESVYGDFIFECYEANDNVEDCYRYCTFEEEDYDREAEEDTEPYH